MKCRNCGDAIDPQRVQLGYDYCLKDECQERCMQRIEIATVGVNKAADQFVRADEVRPPANRVRYSGEDEPDDDLGVASVPPRSARHTGQTESADERLNRAEDRLDAALAASYDRFARGEITAREMDVERNKLIRAFNRLVRAENIRHHSRLRHELPT